MKLTKQQAEELISEAQKLTAKNPSLRYGQALFNPLPGGVGDHLIGTDKDFFYWSNKEIDKILEVFYAECVENEQGE